VKSERPCLIRKAAKAETSAFINHEFQREFQGGHEGQASGKVDPGPPPAALEQNAPGGG